MEDFDYDVLETLVSKKQLGFKLLELKLPGLKPKFEPRKFSYFPIHTEDCLMYVWITDENDVFELEISEQEYLDEIANKA